MLTKGGGDSTWLASRSQKQAARSIEHAHGRVELHGLVLDDGLPPGVLGHANDGNARLSDVAHDDALAERVAIGPPEPRGSLVHDYRDRGRMSDLPRGEGAPSNDARA